MKSKTVSETVFTTTVELSADEVSAITFALGSLRTLYLGQQRRDAEARGVQLTEPIVKFSEAYPTLQALWEALCQDGEH